MDKSQKSAHCTQREDEPWAVITEVMQQALTEMAKSWGAKGKTYGTLHRPGHHGTVPEGTSPSKVNSAEAVRTAELANAGHLVRFWHLPLGSFIGTPTVTRILMAALLLTLKQLDLLI
jgi:hypothetical protein